MVIPTKYDFGRYLAAKKRIDDGALNRNVLDKLRAQLRQTNTHSPLRVLELGAGSSDWVVFPRSDGYNENESYFLHFIVHTIFKDLKGHDSLDRRKFGSWVAQRHSQIEKGELILIAKQMDVLARISVA